MKMPDDRQSDKKIKSRVNWVKINNLNSSPHRINHLLRKMCKSVLSEFFFTFFFFCFLLFKHENWWRNKHPNLCSCSSMYHVTLLHPDVLFLMTWKIVVCYVFSLFFLSRRIRQIRAFFWSRGFIAIFGAICTVDNWSVAIECVCRCVREIL